MKYVIIPTLLVLAACMDQTTVQSSYVSIRDACQGIAEDNLPRFINPNQPGDIKGANAKLVTLFSDCMFEQGWSVATPEREDDLRARSADDLERDIPPSPGRAVGVGAGVAIRPGGI